MQTGPYALFLLCLAGSHVLHWVLCFFVVQLTLPTAFCPPWTNAAEPSLSPLLFPSLVCSSLQVVRIFCDTGRILRPLLVVENLRIKLLKGDDYSFQTLLDKGIIELIGVEEEEDCRTAWGIKYLFMGDKGKGLDKYTHCEIDMSFLLGVSCAIIPFANHDHARRVLYQSEKHSGQALGCSTTNPNIRTDTLSHQIYYPQRPLFRSVIADSLGKPGYPLGRNQILPKEEFFNGQNAIVAVNVHLGYNQEDSIVMNRASLERGMFRTEHIRSYKAEVENKEALDKKVEILSLAGVQSQALTTASS